MDIKTKCWCIKGFYFFPLIVVLDCIVISSWSSLPVKAVEYSLFLIKPRVSCPPVRKLNLWKAADALKPASTKTLHPKLCFQSQSWMFVAAQQLKERWAPDLFSQIMAHTLEACLGELYLPPHHQLLIGSAFIKMCAPKTKASSAASRLCFFMPQWKDETSLNASTAPCQVELRDHDVYFIPWCTVKLGKGQHLPWNKSKEED